DGIRDRTVTGVQTCALPISDVYLAQSAEAWRVPAIAELPVIEVAPAVKAPSDPFLPYARDDRLARPWAIPGTPGLEHRVGGLERSEERRVGKEGAGGGGPGA